MLLAILIPLVTMAILLGLQLYNGIRSYNLKRYFIRNSSTQLILCSDFGSKSRMLERLGNEQFEPTFRVLALDPAEEFEAPLSYSLLRWQLKKLGVHYTPCLLSFEAGKLQVRYFEG